MLTNHKYLPVIFFTLFAQATMCQDSLSAWIRINQLGYIPSAIKVAVWVSKTAGTIDTFHIINATNGEVVFTGHAGKLYGSYGPFVQSSRLAFTNFKKAGRYYVRCGEIVSPVFKISEDIYAGTADFALRYMRQQRSGFNPFLKDSCHTKDGYTVYGPMPDNTHIDVSGGWHDATDYLQYVTTSANATYHLLAAFRDFPGAFTDTHLANGLEGRNGVPDVMDEARWGLDWLVKMNPRRDWMFNQLADDRDHAGMRLPAIDSVDYGNGKGNGRTVYFATGKPQGLGKHQNRSTGVASTAGKFASAFALASSLYNNSDPVLASMYKNKSLAAYQMGLDKPGVCQTAPNREPYFYEEDNWVDDMELASAALFQLTKNKAYFNQSLKYSAKEKVTPWMGADAAKHYQWYPFHNFAHYELAENSDVNTRRQLIGYYKDGIEKVWNKAAGNAFYKGIPFIWCSNNFTVSFAIQCALYRKLSGDLKYAELEQSCLDWLFGCNLWGKCMMYGLPSDGDTPLYPHSSLSYLYHYPLDGGLVDGPLFGSIYKRMVGLKLNNPDKYAAFQSSFVVYHDDVGDYSTNEPTMDGTASLIYLLAGKEQEAHQKKSFIKSNGAIADSQPSPVPAAYLRDSLPSLVLKCSNLLEHAYMAQTLIATTDTLPGWEGFPVKLYKYKTGNDLYTGQPKTGKVYLLNPTPEKLAMWIVTTCWEVKNSIDYKYTDKVFQTIRGQSGAQFPVKGVVYEDQYTKDFQEPYIFKDGVTVYLADSTWFPKDKTCTPQQLEYYLHITNEQLKPQTGRYGRIISTTREMYTNNGGNEDVGDINNRKQQWLKVVRDLYKKAWISDRNELMIAWAKMNLLDIY